MCGFFFGGGGKLKVFAYDLVVVEMVLDAFDNLVVFVAFAGNKNDIVGLSHTASGLDSSLAVGNDKRGLSF